MIAFWEFSGAVIRYALPVLFVALGVLLCQKSGVVNIGAEGLMLLGCLFGVAVGDRIRTAALGVLAAVIVAMAFGAVLGGMIYVFKVNAIVLGVAFNIFASGLCTLLYRSGLGSGRSSGGGLEFGFMAVSGLAAVVLMHIFLYHTRPGLCLRAAGEYTPAAAAMGLPTGRLRFVGFVCGCGLIGFGGACLSMGQLNMFIEDMTDGRGYIALAAVCFGRFTPVGTALAVLLFGVGEALQYRLQAGESGIPHQFALMVPYILTIIGLIIIARRKDRS